MRGGIGTLVLLEHVSTGKFLPGGHKKKKISSSKGYIPIPAVQLETQSEYFDVASVSLHMSILYCHAAEANDGVESTDNSTPLKRTSL